VTQLFDSRVWSPRYGIEIVKAWETGSRLRAVGSGRRNGLTTLTGGEPGLRPHYHAEYFAAFLVDPEDNRGEAVDHRGGVKPASPGIQTSPGQPWLLLRQQ